MSLVERWLTRYSIEDAYDLERLLRWWIIAGWGLGVVLAASLAFTVGWRPAAAGGLVIAGTVFLAMVVPYAAVYGYLVGREVGFEAGEENALGVLGHVGKVSQDQIAEEG